MTATVLPVKPSPTVWHGDCRQIIKQFLPSDSISAIVTDPPYGLEFMGQEWDKYTPAEYQAWCRQWATECFRVLKPGSYLLAFGSTRTSHRLACGIEDAGFEMRDTITWVYSQGFPKSLDIGKVIDKMAGAERTGVIGTGWHRMSSGGHGVTTGHYNECYQSGDSINGTPKFAPVTEAAEQWDGWGTALKPSGEPVIVARKPFKGTVAQNVLTHGTGGMNIDGCRVPAIGRPHIQNNGGAKLDSCYGAGKNGSKSLGITDQGRWPSNLVLSHASTEDGEDACADGCVPGCPVAELDAQSGITVSRSSAGRQTPKNGTAAYGNFAGTNNTTGCDDSGGASRFYPVFRYQAKAPTSQRPKINGLAHPTVKPLAFIEWLVRLVTPAGGLLLDPFAGTGTTGIAAMRLGVVSILIENDPRYWPHITAKIEQEMALR